jgi:ABC-2 type transport system ATP-binding protein
VASLTELLVESAAAGVAVLFSSHQLDLVEDVCQDVVIVDHGRVVLAGAVDRLRDASPRRSLEVVVDGKPWIPDPATGSRVRERDGRVRVLVDAAADPGELLAAARRAGEVTAFSFEPPSLTDLFLETVSGGRSG